MFDILPASAVPDNALSAIRFAREQKLPFLGTCGGFRHKALGKYLINMRSVILSEASRSFIARGAVEEPVLSLPKEPAVCSQQGRFFAEAQEHSLCEYGDTPFRTSPCARFSAFPPLHLHTILIDVLYRRSAQSRMNPE
jgi:hypothetical protein